MIPLNLSSFLVVGLARNCEKQLSQSVDRLSDSFSSAKALRFLIIESDSSDKTLNILCQLKFNDKNIDYISLGCLQDEYPIRTSRIAFCRNHYLRLIKEVPDYQDVDYVVVADLDGVNSKLTSSSVASCWTRTDWDVCTANQDGPYYDIWALRHPLWSPNDWKEQAAFMMNTGLSRFKSIFLAVYSRMITLNPHGEWIEVDSAFGGLAIYRKTVLHSVSYVGLMTCGKEICEHVTLHQQIRDNGGRIFINPMMVNAAVVEHAKSATDSGIICFWFRCLLRDLACKLRILTYFKKARAFFKGLRA